MQWLASDEDQSSNVAIGVALDPTEARIARMLADLQVHLNQVDPIGTPSDVTADDSLARPIPVPRRVLESIREVSFDGPVLQRMRQTPQCVICCSDFEVDEALSQLPGCGHLFHSGCVHEWLARRATCPICRCDLCEAVGGACLSPSTPSSVVLERDGLHDSLDSYRAFDMHRLHVSLDSYQGVDTSGLSESIDSHGGDTTRVLRDSRGSYLDADAAEAGAPLWEGLSSSSNSRGSSESSPPPERRTLSAGGVASVPHQVGISFPSSPPPASSRDPHSSLRHRGSSALVGAGSLISRQGSAAVLPPLQHRAAGAPSIRPHGAQDAEE